MSPTCPPPQKNHFFRWTYNQPPHHRFFWRCKTSQETAFLLQGFCGHRFSCIDTTCPERQFTHHGNVEQHGGRKSQHLPPMFFGWWIYTLKLTAPENTSTPGSNRISTIKFSGAFLLLVFWGLYIIYLGSYQNTEVHSGSVVPPYWTTNHIPTVAGLRIDMF